MANVSTLVKSLAVVCAFLSATYAAAELAVLGGDTDVLGSRAAAGSDASGYGRSSLPTDWYSDLDTDRVLDAANSGPGGSVQLASNRAEVAGPDSGSDTVAGGGTAPAPRAGDPVAPPSPNRNPDPGPNPNPGPSPNPGPNPAPDPPITTDPIPVLRPLERWEVRDGHWEDPTWSAAEWTPAKLVAESDFVPAQLVTPAKWVPKTLVTPARWEPAKTIPGHWENGKWVKPKKEPGKMIPAEYKPGYMQPAVWSEPYWTPEVWEPGKWTPATMVTPPTWVPPTVEPVTIYVPVDSPEPATVPPPDVDTDPPVPRRRRTPLRRSSTIPQPPRPRLRWYCRPRWWTPIRTRTPIPGLRRIPTLHRIPSRLPKRQQANPRPFPKWQPLRGRSSRLQPRHLSRHRPNHRSRQPEPPTNHERSASRWPILLPWWRILRRPPPKVRGRRVPPPNQDAPRSVRAERQQAGDLHPRTHLPGGRVGTSAPLRETRVDQRDGVVRKIFRPRRLSTRLVVPFCLLVTFLSVAGAWFLTRQTIGSLEERTLAQLADVTTRAQLVVGDAEAEALNTVNRLTFTRGLAESVAAGDTAVVSQTAAAMLATSDARRVSIVAADLAASGGVRIVVDSDRRRHPDPAGWEADPAAQAAAAEQLSSVGALQDALAGTADATGDKYVALVGSVGPAPAVLAVMAPLRMATAGGGEEIVGAVVVSMPLEELVSDMRARLGLDAAVLALDGTVLASTFGEDGPFALGHDAVAEAMTGRRAATTANWHDGSYTVSAGPLDMRGQTRGLVAAAIPESPVQKSVSATRMQVLLLFAGGLVGVLLLGMAISRRIAGNVNELATAADAVASGDFDRRVEPRSDDELGVLSVAFNNMAQRLSAYRESQEEVISRLRDVDRAKDELIDNISHELRTPLTPIKGSARILERSDLDDDTRRQMAEMIAQNSDRLLEQVNRLIAASSSAAGRGEPPRNPVDVTAVAQDVLTRRVPADQRTRVRLETDFGVPRVAGDEGAIGQILFDLLDNALKFSDGEVVVHLATDETAATVEVAVADHGIGVAEAERERIFERFYQVDGSSTRRHGGLGLGLAVVAGLVEWLDGEVTVLDRGVGEEDQGTTFRVSPAAAEREVTGTGKAAPGLLGLAVQRVATQPR